MDNAFTRRIRIGDRILLEDSAPDSRSSSVAALCAYRGGPLISPPHATWLLNNGWIQMVRDSVNADECPVLEVGAVDPIIICHVIPTPFVGNEALTLCRKMLSKKTVRAKHREWDTLLSAVEKFARPRLRHPWWYAASDFDIEGSRAAKIRGKHNRDKGAKAERYEAMRGGSLVPGSGCGWRKGDIVDGEVLKEVKSRAKFHVKKEWLDKLYDQALACGKIPMLVVLSEGKRWVVTLFEGTTDRAVLDDGSLIMRTLKGVWRCHAEA